MHQGICMSCGHLQTWLQAFFDIKFCRRYKNIQFTIRILLRPTLSMKVTKIAVKDQRSLRWETETMEVESGSHRGQTIAPFSTQYFDKAPTSYNQQLTQQHLHLTQCWVQLTHWTQLTHNLGPGSTYPHERRTGSYAHIIALINFGTPVTLRWRGSDFGINNLSFQKMLQ